MKILAFAGRRYCGSDIAADMVLAYDPRFQRTSFTDAVKQDFCLANKLDPRKLRTPGLGDVYSQQLYTHERTLKALDPFYFASRALGSLGVGDFVVIDDLSQVEELKYLLLQEAVIYKVHSDPCSRRSRGWLRGEIDDHYSETEMDQPGAWFHKITGGRGGTIFNTKTELQDPEKVYLRRQIMDLMGQHF